MRAFITKSWFDVHYNHPKRLKRFWKKYTGRNKDIIAAKTTLIKYNILAYDDVKIITNTKHTEEMITLERLRRSLKIHENNKNGIKILSENELRDSIVNEYDNVKKIFIKCGII